MTQNNTQEFGITSWADLKTNNKNNQVKKDEYLKLPPGTHRVRIVTPPFPKVVYSFKEWDGDNRKFGDTILSSCTPDDPIKLMAAPKWEEVEALNTKAKDLLDAGKKEESEVLTEKAKKLKAKIKERGWVAKKNAVFKVIDRKTGRIKVLEAGPLLSGKISELARTGWGDPQNYDIDITVNDKPASPNDWYAVTPAPGGNGPLTADELKAKEEIDLEEMKRKVTPPTPEKVRERLAAVRAKRAGTTTETTDSNHESSATVEEDFTFEQVDVK